MCTYDYNLPSCRCTCKHHVTVHRLHGPPDVCATALYSSLCSIAQYHQRAHVRPASSRLHWRVVNHASSDTTTTTTANTISALMAVFKVNRVNLFYSSSSETETLAISGTGLLRPDVLLSLNQQSQSTDAKKHRLPTTASDDQPLDSSFLIHQPVGTSQTDH